MLSEIGRLSFLYDDIGVWGFRKSLWFTITFLAFSSRDSRYVIWSLFLALSVPWNNVFNPRFLLFFQIIWASAIFPYIILTILCGKALTLDGAWDGLKFLFTPNWEILKTSQCWIDGGTQIFFSYGVGIGALLAMGSYNKFHHNVVRDAVMICGINTFTSFFSATVIFSILGFMAKEKGVEIGDVVKQGPGLAFLVYPEVRWTLWKEIRSKF